MNEFTEFELIYGPGIKTELDAVKLCLETILRTQSVVDIKGMEIVKTYLSLRTTELEER